ncbi:glutathione S-transferase-like isoform X3 [Alligator sinensis]|uniref:glutathione transferase n=1 Tax=Alligator sinensis TaxID=38654 RepID=A0A3Q0GNB4_ALLSI|nr:glutathione S-transferase-like isoform X3 [Alligator sinensis]
MCIKGKLTGKNMSGKVKLHYFNGRGRMETIRWLLAGAGVEFEEYFFETREELIKLQQSGVLLFQIDMYVEATMDLNDLIMRHPMQPPEGREKNLALIVDKATNRYFPAYEKVLKDHGQDYLVGNQFSRADVQVLETILMMEEMKPDILAKFPLLQGFKARISNIPTIKKFLQPGSQRKSKIEEKMVPQVMKIFYG